MNGTFDSVAQHYGGGDIAERVFAALAAEGIDTASLSWDQLSSFDQFHTRGLAATKEQAEIAEADTDTHMLDVGCGAGGPARYLAATCGCRVTGIDLTAEYVDLATTLSVRCGMDDVTAFRQANALDMPFEEAAFDLAWSQNVSMNIEDKVAFYREIFRVLRPGGRFVSADIAGGSGGAPEFPLPWAREPSISFVGAQDDLKSALETAGFEIQEWRDTTADAVAIAQAPSQVARRGALGVGLIAGSDFGARSLNLGNCLADGRLTSVLFAARRPA